MTEFDSNVKYLHHYDSRRLNDRTKRGKMRRVAALTRVSTEHEEQIEALKNQNEWIVSLIDQNKDTWIFNPDCDMYIEESKSGTSLKKRDQFNKLIQNAIKGKYDLIVTREVSRFMRNARLTLDLVDDLKQYNVEVYFVNDNIWTFNDDDYFKLSIMAQYAEAESRKIAERVYSGQAIARENGVLFGNGNILGYDLIKGDKSSDTNYIINEEQAEIVRLIYKLCIEGEGIGKIKRYLEDNGYKTASGNSEWNFSAVQRVLHNTTYMGVLGYNKYLTEDSLSHKRKRNKDKSEIIEKQGRFPAIIDKKTFDLAQKSINSRKSENFERGKKNSKDIYQQRLRCGCGRRFRRDQETDTKFITYNCWQVKDDGGIKKRKIKSELLNDNCCINGVRDWKLDYISLKVFEYLDVNIERIQTHLLDVLERCYVDSFDFGINTVEIRNLRDAISELEGKKASVINLKDSLSELQYNNMVSEFTSKIEELKDRINELKEKSNILENKHQVLSRVKKYVETCLKFPSINGKILKVPDSYIQAYINSIVVGANNSFEYNVRTNPNIESDVGVTEEELNSPLYHNKRRIIDNSNAVTIAEFEISYGEAKAYANSLGKKLRTSNWGDMAKVKIVMDI